MLWSWNVGIHVTICILCFCHVCVLCFCLPSLAISCQILTVTPHVYSVYSSSCSSCPVRSVCSLVFVCSVFIVWISGFAATIWVSIRVLYPHLVATPTIRDNTDENVRMFTCQITAHAQDISMLPKNVTVLQILMTKPFQSLLLTFLLVSEILFQIYMQRAMKCPQIRQQIVTPADEGLFL